MKLELQETSSAFGGDIPEGAWHTISTHTSVATAHEAKAASRAAMRERCGPSAWDSHRRIVNAGVLPIRLSVTWICLGTYENEHADDCAREVVLTYDWQPGEPEPGVPFPKDWWSAATCGKCHQIDVAREAAEAERWEQEQEAEWDRAQLRELERTAR